MGATRFLTKMQTEILKLNADSVEKAKNLLLNGEVVAIPTETVYGLGAIGLNPTAVKKIFEIKGRPSDNPLIAHVHEDYDLTKLVHIEKGYAKKPNRTGKSRKETKTEKEQRWNNQHRALIPISAF